MQIDGAVLDIDYLVGDGGKADIRITVKGTDGKTYDIYDRDFRPYFYLLPSSNISAEELMAVAVPDGGSVVRADAVEKCRRRVLGKDEDVFKIVARGPINVPKLSGAMSRFGTCYEFDIPFAKRYAIDKDITPLSNYTITAANEGGALVLRGMKPSKDGLDVKLNVMCFDIEVYNPLGVPRPNKDQVIMISYVYRSRGAEGSGVITYKSIKRGFVEVVKDEKELLSAFANKVKELDIDVIAGYNSANFDIKYLLDRARRLGVKFNLSRYEGETRLESHGLVQRVKIGGVVHVDIYQVVKFISIVGASESILKLNSYTLKNVYEAISGGKKTTVDKMNIYRLWDGSAKELEELAEYNLSDSLTLQEVYDMFIPIMIEMARTTGDVLSDTAVSTTGQLVDYLCMRYANRAGEMIPNKPAEDEIRSRLLSPIEGAYVKTPEPGIYENLAIFDFRGLYPSIIISYNIDPATICHGCDEYYESPLGTKFDKLRKGVIPAILKMLIDQRASVKKQYKKSPDDKFLGARSSALKILSNSFYGYLGYARSRWYSRDCAGSVTAYGRQYIKDTIRAAEDYGFRVLYADTDSIVFLLGGKTKDDALAFLKGFNSKLPENMELEVEDFFTRGVFVGKKTETGVAGAKKKYAMISESGRIKIRGFELVRRDWSWVARDTQKRVLEAILKDGSAEKAAQIVKEVVRRLREGKVPLKDLAINTQLRKGIDSYDAKSPELGAARKAVKAGQKTRDEVEDAVISYVITRHGSTISDKAELEEFARDYDPDYYINNQVIPATMRILKELNFNEDELKGLGTQKKLI
ncbi:MAG: DNA-directed DNA polymerase [Candidatus Marsarchaeota archaeon]|nr:DNA-directed DNA polymerase [Candidatus Marsarchaeota archaeon]MCL5111409.1 DNA-directed DNA polymerase [Candidatus Marsarchaeota archaeon]